MTYSAAAEARARARRSAIADGTAWTVRFAGKDGEEEVVEARYDALGLARSLVWNGNRTATLASPEGVVYDADGIERLRY